MSFNNSSAATAQPVPPRNCEYYLYLCQPWYRASFYEPTIASAVVNIPLALIATLGNGLALAAYYHSETLRRPIFTILMFVAVTDFLTGAVSQPLFTFVMVKTLYTCPDYVCSLHFLANLGMLFFMGASILNLLVITVDRYIAVFHCYQYEEIVTNSRIVKLLILLWSSWFALIQLSRVRGIGFTVNQLLGVLMILVIISILIFYFKILREVRRLESNLAVPANQPQEIKNAKERKSAITAGYILLALLVCFVPMVFYLFILPRVQGNSRRAMESRRSVFLAATSCYLANSSVNVFIYSWKNQEMKTAMLKVIRMVKQKFQNEVTPLN